MQAKDLQNRTKSFSLKILDLVEKLPNTISGRAIANQIVRSGTSVAANYRAVCRARSDREFIAKMAIVTEESDETLFWIEIIGAKDFVNQEYLNPIKREANELTAIFVGSLKSIKHRTSQNS